jgi:hypothetical protein
MRTGVIVWAVFCALVSVALATLARRLGERAIAWLVAVGVTVLAIEEPALTLWLSAATPSDDKDGIATLVTAMARAHVVTAAIMALVPAFVLVRVAFTAFRRGDAWATRLLRWAFALAAVAELGTSALIFSRGLPLPGPGGRAGASAFGWQPVAAGLFAWGLGLVLDARRARTACVALTDARHKVRPYVSTPTAKHMSRSPVLRQGRLPTGVGLRLCLWLRRALLARCLVRGQPVRNRGPGSVAAEEMSA